MRIWDVSPGYLSRQSLLGEHRELHGLYSILVNGRDGYSRHPETLRWVGCVSGLVRRHAQLAAEMRVRGYTDRSPLRRRPRVVWPASYIDSPGDQLAILGGKYAGKTSGRMRLPKSPQDLWAQHKFSVMARDPARYREIGRRVARMKKGTPLGLLALELVTVLRSDPPANRLVNAVEHMWGYVARHATPADRRQASRTPARLFATTCRLAREPGQDYLQGSTALSDLALFVDHASLSGSFR